MLTARDLKALGYSTTTLTRYANEGLIDHARQVAKNRWGYPDHTEEVLRACAESPKYEAPGLGALARYAAARHYVWWEKRYPLGEWGFWQRDRLSEIDAWILGLNAISLMLRQHGQSSDELAATVVEHLDERRQVRHRGALFDGRRASAQDKRALLGWGIAGLVAPDTAPAITDFVAGSQPGETYLDLLRRAAGFTEAGGFDEWQAVDSIVHGARQLGWLDLVTQREAFASYTVESAERARDHVQSQTDLTAALAGMAKKSGIEPTYPMLAAMWMAVLALPGPEGPAVVIEEGIE